MFRRKNKDNGLREHFGNYNPVAARAVAFLKESERVQKQYEESEEPVPFDSLVEPGCTLEATADEVLTHFSKTLTQDVLIPCRSMSILSTRQLILP